MKFILAVVALLAVGSVAEAGFRCTTTGNTTRCVDEDGTVTRCTVTGNTTRCR